MEKAMHRHAMLLAPLALLASPIALPALAQDRSDRIDRIGITWASYPENGGYWVPASGEILAVNLGDLRYDGILIVRDNVNGYANAWHVSYDTEGVRRDDRTGRLGYAITYLGPNLRDGRIDFVVLWYDESGSLYMVQAGDRYWLVN